MPELAPPASSNPPGFSYRSDAELWPPGGQVATYGDGGTGRGQVMVNHYMNHYIEVGLIMDNPMAHTHIYIYTYMCLIANRD